MKMPRIPENPYVLLTPGPLSTTWSVRAAMLQDWCTWDSDYNAIVQEIRKKLVRLATDMDGYTAVLMQGSGTFCVEATLGTTVPRDGRLLILTNGAYGDRMVRIAERLAMSVDFLDSGEVNPPDLHRLEGKLSASPSITHVAVVHCETTTGMLNPVNDIGALVKAHGLTYIVDAMSSFGGIPLDMAHAGADYLISSANKCIQGVPGFGFVIADRLKLESTKGQARSLCLDLHDQWEVMERQNGKWRFTSPTHVVKAFAQALIELEEEGGVPGRHERYRESHRVLVDGMENLGFECLLPEAHRSPIITSFLSPSHPGYEFKRFYSELKSRGFVIYPGKVTSADTFRIGNIGDIGSDCIQELLVAVRESMTWL